MAECYPTGCTPCDTPISFPEDPANGDTHCIDIGGDSKKCWTYDSCIPGWRAQGPSASPAVYRGGINIKVDSPGENIEAGHFYIQIGTVTAPYQLEWGAKVQQVSPVVANNRIAFNGREWEVLPGPDIPFAEEARDTNPSPENRIAGIVYNASLQDALAGTKKCDAITPYTLKNVVDQELDPIKDEIDNLNIGNGALTLRINGTNLTSFTANQDTDLTLDLTSQIQEAGVPVGTIIAFAGNSTPSGYLWCNGASISQTSYANLFAVIGLTYGNPGGSNFRVPDLRGEFLRGHDGGRGVDPGRSFGSRQTDQYRSHSHSGSGSTYSNVMYETPGASNIISTSQGNRPYRLRTISTAGAASGGAETRPTNVAIRYCIKY